MNDPSGRSTHEIDIVAVGEPGPGRRTVLALGEANWSERLGLAAPGFTPELVAAAGRGEAVLVDLDRLYSGS